MNILTFDVEDWFHILDHDRVRYEYQWASLEKRLPQNLDRILELLDRNGTAATFFCLGWAAREFPELIRRIDAAGHEIGSHSDVHALIYDQTPRECANHIRRSRLVLEDVIGKPVKLFRAPGFSLVQECNWAFEILIENEFEIDCSIFPASRAHGGYPNFPASGPVWVETQSGRIKEFPINTRRVLSQDIIFSGGGYFRMLPQGVLDWLWKESPYVMTYFHPRDFDPFQPIVPGLSAWRRFKCYCGLSGAEVKLQRFLETVQFSTVSRAAEIVDWSVAPVVKVGSRGAS